ncbi:hypothetical protein HanRHA438_Chr13g0605321 [Helianthus annuus]|nr:hypothetical protein HanRHA438_Chr13g0605321 [Helianthus annuus]
MFTVLMECSSCLLEVSRLCLFVIALIYVDMFIDKAQLTISECDLYVCMYVVMYVCM